MRIPVANGEKYSGIPLLAWQTICMLDMFLTKTMNVFEWGAGGSTIFLARRVANLVTIEHDSDWYKYVKEALEYNSLSPTVSLIPPSSPSGKGDCARSGVKMYQGLSFEDYVQAIDEFPPNHFDAVLVDGRAREACLAIAETKLRPGGILILDNAERTEYKAAIDRIDWPVELSTSSLPYHADTVKVTTALWLKP